MPVKGYLPEKHLETQHPGFLLEAGHTGSLCLVHTYRRLPAGRQVFNINHVVSTDRLGIVSHSYQFWKFVGKLPKSQFPDVSQGLSLQQASPKIAFSQIAVSCLTDS